MNKKKFFATCTLVAFGATMVPTMAFATSTPGTSIVGTLNGQSKTVDITCDVADKWVGAGDTLKLEQLMANGKLTDVTSTYVASKSIETAFGAGADNDPDTVADNVAAVVRVTLKKPLPAANYTFTLTNTDGSDSVAATTTTKGSKAATDITPGNATVSSTNGCVDFPDALGDGDKVYDLGTSVDGREWIANNATPAFTASSTSAKKVPAKYLRADHFYGVVAAAGTAGVPTKIVKCSAKVLSDAQEALAKAKADLQAGIDSIPSELVFDVASLASQDLENLIVDKATGLTETQLGILSIEEKDGEYLKNYVAENYASYDERADAYTIKAAGSGVESAASIPGTVTNLTGTVKLVAADSGVGGAYSTIKSVKVTLRTVAANVGAAVDVYGKDKFADYDKDNNTASATLRKVGDGFEKDTIQYDNGGVTSKTFTIAAENVKLGETSLVGAEVVEYFKDGKVVKLPAEDITMDVILDASTNKAAGEFITVKTTIKAAGEQTDLDKATADLLAVIQRRNALITEIVADKKIDQSESTRFAAINVELNAALEAFEAAGGDVNAAL